MRHHQGLLQDRLFGAYNRLDGFETVVSMPQLKGIRPQQFFVNLQRLNSMNIHRGTYYLERRRIIGKHDFVAGLDAEKAVRRNKKIE